MIPDKLRILNVEPINFSNEARSILQSIGELVEKEVRSRDELINLVKDFDVLIVRLRFQIDKKILKNAPRLKVIVSATTGLDHIDLDFAKSRGISILSLKGESEFLRSIPATAEHTWALLLSLVRKIPWAFDDVKRGHWNRDNFRGHDLEGKKLGVLGFGRIGEKVAKYALAFNMEIGAYDPYRKEWPDYVKRFHDIENFLKWLDILTIHIPLNNDTRCFVDRRKLIQMRKGSLIINTSRGDVIDEKALVDLLKSGHIAGAALDVVSGETTGSISHDLILYASNNQNLIITPHIGGATQESMWKTEVFMAKKLRKWVTKHVHQ